MMWDHYNSRYRERTMNKTIFATLALATTVAFAGPAFADKYKAALDGKSENPPTTSTGTGTADIDYDAAKGVVRLTKNAWLSDGQNEVRGESLKYNVIAQSIIADAADQNSQRVHIIITPTTTPTKP